MDFNEAGEASFFTFIGLSHAEDVPSVPAGGVADHNQPTRKHPEADDSFFAIGKAQVFKLQRDAFKNDYGILEIQPPLVQGAVTLGWTVGDAHLLYIQKT